MTTSFNLQHLTLILLSEFAWPWAVTELSFDHFNTTGMYVCNGRIFYLFILSYRARLSYQGACLIFLLYLWLWTVARTFWYALLHSDVIDDITRPALEYMRQPHVAQPVVVYKPQCHRPESSFEFSLGLCPQCHRVLLPSPPTVLIVHLSTKFLSTVLLCLT